MASAAPPFPRKPLDKAAIAHCGRERLSSGTNWSDHCAFRGVDISPVCAVDAKGDGEKHRYYARYSAGVVEPLHMHQQADLEWVVLSGKFTVEAGPIADVPGHDRVLETLVAGSWMAIPKGQPYELRCVEVGVVFVSYNGNPSMKTFHKQISE